MPGAGGSREAGRGTLPVRTKRAGQNWTDSWTERQAGRTDSRTINGKQQQTVRFDLTPNYASIASIQVQVFRREKKAFRSGVWVLGE